ncbi:hypothetical protein OG589_14415 [Sphaerisporangium sp. NBC_01403]|uniref:hypothetical protein n=1 Tax=Sphaerisporangium sp. NBC_01403 TaxID=2903599 RepID=UPI0032538C8D
MDKVSKSQAQDELTQASHYTPAPQAAKKLLDRAADLKGDVTREELNQLLKPWT